MGKTCLHRFCGDCQDCKEDYEPITPTHPVNNYNCKIYHEINFLTHEVVELKLRDKIRISLNESSFGDENLRDKLLKKRFEEQKKENQI
jgi:hypothetical protein